MMVLMRLVPIAVVAALLTATPATASAQPAAPAPPPAPAVRLGVLLELTVNVSDERATQLAAALADALHRELEVDAVGGADVARQLPDGGVPDECVAQPACIADLGARLDATELLFIAVVQVGPDIHVDASWADVRTGEVLARPRVELAADARAGEVFAAAATRLLPHARKRPLAVVVEPGKPGPAGPRRHLTRGTWIAGGVAAAALAGGVGLGLSARATFRRCERDPEDCDPDTRDGLGHRALAADLLLGGALAGAATAVVLYLRSDRDADAAGDRAAWSVTPTRGGAIAGWRVGF